MHVCCPYPLSFSLVQEIIVLAITNMLVDAKSHVTDSYSSQVKMEIKGMGMKKKFCHMVMDKTLGCNIKWTHF